eukprot:CAMPEP_0115883592 /NCGR_PEP_ID=MMETSP0287-20121206/29646_1 /TAXON_ID=412157 /ORGANISM="Chrysochromulina rotalis, Strain UIO044" /LENGTH=82 /DNA_ID=CAMNT_0003339799 /DNA_START=63 /DNA_END=308 /DNA_ORIENTATION=+
MIAHIVDLEEANARPATLANGIDKFPIQIGARLVEKERRVPPRADDHRRSTLLPQALHLHETVFPQAQCRYLVQVGEYPVHW